MWQVITVVLLSCSTFTLVDPTGVSAMSGFVDGDNNTYYISPNWGFSLGWNPEKWQVVDETSDAGRDYLVLESTIDRVTIESSTQYGDGSSCLYDQLERITSDSRVSRLEIVPDPQRGSGFVEAWTPFAAFAHFSYDVTTDDGTDWIAHYIDCRTLKPGEAVVIFTHVAFAENYDEWEEYCCGFDPILDTLTLPRSAWDHSPFAPTEQWWETADSRDPNVEVLRFIADTGEDGSDSPNGDHVVAVSIRFTNTGDEPDFANASAVYLRDQYDVLYVASSYQWNDDDPPDQREYYQSLDPGESTTATVFFPTPDDAVISSVHCNCFADPLLVEEPIYRLFNRAGALRSASQDNGPSVYVDLQGRERLMFSVKEWIASKPNLEYPVSIVNVSSRTLSVDPEAFIIHALGRDSDDVTTTTIGGFRWELAPGDLSDQVQRLAPGDHAIVYVTFTPADDSIYHELAFVVSDDQIVPITMVANSIGGSTGRPRISRGGSG